MEKQNHDWHKIFSLSKNGIYDFLKSRSPRAVAGKIIIVAILIFVVTFLTLRFSPYSDLRKFSARQISTRVYDRNGELIQILSLQDGLRREFVSLEEMPDGLAEIFIAAEDRRFFSHHGVDVGAIFRAAFQNVSERRTVSGASTITMQLARIISPSPKRTLPTKIGEAFNALRLEARLSKNEILEMYLNNVPFGFNSEGVATASRTFFGTSVKQLSPAQMFCLAVIPRRPSFYNPLENPENCATAASDLYSSLIKDVSVSRFQQKDVAAGGNTQNENEASIFLAASQKAKSFRYPFEMPHYIRFLATQNIGLYALPEVQLSAMLPLQKEAESLLAQRVERYGSYRLTNGAVLVTDTRTGEILAWVGSADFSNDANNGQVDGVLATVQPGSSMKPFLYALALEHGYSPATILPDVPLEFGFEQLYVPQNFNNRYNGPVRLRVALASSLNVPAVYLLNTLGMTTYREKLSELQFNSLERSDPGLALALGGGEVSIYEMVRAFSVFPRDGILLPLVATRTQADTRPIANDSLQAKKSQSAKTSTSEKKSATDDTSASGGRVFSRDTARLICDILSDKDARATGFGYAQTFVTPFPSMFKTGTANQFQNITALGATPLYTVGVWMGNFSGETVIGQTGSSIPAQIARELLVRLHGRGNSPSFNAPSQFVREKICALSGMKAGRFCTGTLMEYVSAGTSSSRLAEASALANESLLANASKSETCTWHTGSGVVYPAEYAQWFRLKNRSGAISENDAPLEIVSPKNGSVFFYDASLAGRNQNLVIDAIGGSEDVAVVSVHKTAPRLSEQNSPSRPSAHSGQDAHNESVSSSERTFEIARPFSFQLPLEKGEHTVAISCGNETATLQFSVK